MNMTQDDDGDDYDDDDDDDHDHDDDDDGDVESLWRELSWSLTAGKCPCRVAPAAGETGEIEKGETADAEKQEK